MIKLQGKHVSTEQQKTQTRLIFSTTEILSELDLANIEKAPGYLYFSADKVAQEAELVMRDTRIGINDAGQSKSKQLRGAIYEYWMANVKGQDYEAYYNEVMNKLINRVKGKNEA